MTRDLSDGDYDSHGGKIPLKWTAPEVCTYMMQVMFIIINMLAAYCMYGKISLHRL